MFYENLSCKIEFKKKLTLPCNKPNINHIKNVNIDIDVLGIKVISTPLNEIVQKENLNLSKERLLIAGWLCIKICYASSPNNRCINTAFFKVPFNTYIPLNKSATCCKDKFSINSCIKNICVTPCSCRVFEQKLTLLLYAKKINSISSNQIIPPPHPKPDPIPPPIPPRNKLPNAIIINDNDFLEIAKIEFDSTTKKVLVTSKSLIADLALGSNSYFSFILKNKNNIIKTSASIISNKTADDFATILNNTPFSYGDTLELNYLMPSRFLITNFPINNENYIPRENKEFYSITEKGFIPIVDPTPKPEPEPTPEVLIEKLPNSIIVNNNLNKEVAKIEFNVKDNILIVTSTEEIPDISKGTDAYFGITLQDMITSKLKASSFIMANKNANTFQNELNGVSFEKFDTLQLNCLNPSNIKITNFPIQDEIYTLKDTLELFTITPAGLQSFIEPTPPPIPVKDKLPNAIIIEQNNDVENGLIALIEFNILDNKLSVSSSSLIPNTTKDINYFSFKLKDNNNQNIKYSSSILSNKNADNFANELNDKSFEFNDILELDYLMPNFIVITNYPKAEENHTPTNNKEYYKITAQGLISYMPTI